MSKITNDTAKFTFTGTRVKWLTRKGPNMGNAQVMIDATNKGTVNLYSASPVNPFQQSYTVANGTHTITIKVLGTKDLRSSDFNVVVDGFVVGATTTQDNSLKVQYNNWKGAFSASASGGSYRSNAAAGSDAKFTFLGNSVNWITAKGPSYGKVNVVVDGGAPRLIDLYNSTQQWQVSLTFAVSGPGPQHTIEIMPTGTKNTLSSGKNIVVDEFRGNISPVQTNNAGLALEPDEGLSYLPLLALLALIGLFRVRRRS